jgi:hypothetical protein
MSGKYDLYTTVIKLGVSGAGGRDLPLFRFTPRECKA